MNERGNPIINARIKFMQAKKERLLKMKKAERGNELKITEDIIARLKRWNRELEAKKTRENLERAGQKMAEACQNTVKACQEFTEAMGRLNNREKQRGVIPVKYK